jgi:hypothetical protein
VCVVLGRVLVLGVLGCNSFPIFHRTMNTYYQPSNPATYPLQLSLFVLLKPLVMDHQAFFDGT